MTIEQRVLLAALLHDIGKFRQRAHGNELQGQTHQKLGSDWLREMGYPDDVCGAAMNHHRNGVSPDESWTDLVVGAADNFALGGTAGKEDVEQGEVGQWQLQAGLASVFSRLKLDRTDGSDFHDVWSCYAAKEWTQRLQYPDKWRESFLTQRDYRALWDSFQEDFLNLPQDYRQDPATLLILLEKHASAIPSEIRSAEDRSRGAMPDRDPDISLFDHLKVTASIAVCLLQSLIEEAISPEQMLANPDATVFSKQGERFLLVGGDISGVQRFVYTITSRGALKTLRARSFFLELLTEHAVQRILENAGLSRASLVYSGGGHFYLLAANTKNTKKVLEDVTNQTNSWLLDKHQGRLFLSVAYQEFSGKELLTEGDLAVVWGSVTRQLSEKKGHKFDRNLRALLEPREPLLGNCASCGESVFDCQVCHEEAHVYYELPREPGRLVVHVCDTCNELSEIGDDLSEDRMKFLVGTSLSAPLHRPKLQVVDRMYWVFDEPPRSGAQEITFVVNSSDIRDYAAPNRVPLWIGNYATPDNGRTADFETLANRATGVKRLGVLRMDVDRLGQVFTQGLRREDRSLPRLTSMSRLLTRFFKLHLNEICARRLGDELGSITLSEKQGVRNVTIVYSGGDDLFLVGAWDEVVELAFDIHATFKRFTCNNPDLDISGGVTVHDPKFPLYQMAIEAGDAEDKAKDRRPSIAPFYSSAISIRRADDEHTLSPAFRWAHEGAKILELAQGLARHFSKKEPGRLSLRVPRAFLYSLFSTVDLWRREGVIYLPQMAYIIARIQKTVERLLRELSEHEQQDVMRAWLHLRNALMCTDTINYLHPVLTWIDLLQRGGDENGTRT